MHVNRNSFFFSFRVLRFTRSAAMAEQPSFRNPPRSEYVDSTGRVVIARRPERLSDYVDAWRLYIESLDPERCMRQNCRQLAEAALDCPAQMCCGIKDCCKSACEAMATPRLVWF